MAFSASRLSAFSLRAADSASARKASRPLPSPGRSSRCGSGSCGPPADFRFFSVHRRSGSRRCDLDTSGWSPGA
eukprot:11453912-Heterocapsa_arctica.AAC.1